MADRVRRGACRPGFGDVLANEVIAVFVDDHVRVSGSVVDHDDPCFVPFEERGSVRTPIGLGRPTPRRRAARAAPRGAVLTAPPLRSVPRGIRADPSARRRRRHPRETMRGALSWTVSHSGSPRETAGPPETLQAPGTTTKTRKSCEPVGTLFPNALTHPRNARESRNARETQSRALRWRLSRTTRGNGN